MKMSRGFVAARNWTDIVAPRSTIIISAMVDDTLRSDGIYFRDRCCAREILAQSVVDCSPRPAQAVALHLSQRLLSLPYTRLTSLVSREGGEGESTTCPGMLRGRVAISMQNKKYLRRIG
ncbi:hypothetical protein N7G274_008528 [Stereocaulon virgatum]|uniref:Uncharacterized protein n=1 Tax=Stereocaulon virgatum TaxID=373712 RepID=A0ABR3ZZX4_9LECA